jgi:hypothetical protein
MNTKVKADDIIPDFKVTDTLHTSGTYYEPAA